MTPFHIHGGLWKLHYVKQSQSKRRLQKTREWNRGKKVPSNRDNSCRIMQGLFTINDNSGVKATFALIFVYILVAIVFDHKKRGIWCIWKHDMILKSGTIAPFTSCQFYNRWTKFGPRVYIFLRSAAKIFWALRDPLISKWYLYPTTSLLKQWIHGMKINAHCAYI